MICLYSVQYNVSQHTMSILCVVMPITSMPYANLVPIWCQYALSAQPASTKSAPQNNPTGILCFFLFPILINLDPFSSTSTSTFTSTSTEYVCVWGRQLIAFFSSPFLNLRETSSYRLVQLCRTQYNPLQPCTRVKFK